MATGRTFSWTVCVCVLVTLTLGQNDTYVINSTASYDQVAVKLKVYLYETCLFLSFIF